MVYLYYKKFPKVDDIVKAKIEKINQLGIEVTLPEYDNLNGYITYNFTVSITINTYIINIFSIIIF